MMKLYLKNIGKINEVTIEINGITVITGYNDTGKSTIGKTLFSIFESFYDIQNKIKNTKISYIKNSIFDNFEFIRNMYRSIYSIRENIDKLVKYIYDNYINFKDNAEELKKIIVEEIRKINFDSTVINNELFDEFINGIFVGEDDIIKTIIENNFNNIFKNQICNMFLENNSKVILKLKDKNILMDFIDNSIKNINYDTIINTEAIYIDNPFILDEIDFGIKDNSIEKRSLINKLLLNTVFLEDEINPINKLITEKKLSNIYDKINTICNGEITLSRISGFKYRMKNTEKELMSKNISTGLKTFIILKILLENGSLKSNGTIILDEPEIHLHPEWQLVFAEIIVLLNLEFNMHILLTTHSPYFLNAIEVYSKKYKLENKTKYYLANNNNDGSSNIEDVTHNIEWVYEKLAKPFTILENMEYGEDEY